MSEIITSKGKVNIENMIYEVRDKQVMLDKDLAFLYNVSTGALNRQVKRNIERFPQDFCFQLTKDEYENLKCQFGISNKNENEIGRGGRRTLPFAFTENGISMLSSVLHTEIAINASINIMRTFVSMRKYISSNLIQQKYINNQVIKNTEDIKLLKESFKKFEEKRKINEIYFNGQIYDAYSKIVDIMKEATKEIIIIDNYMDKTILDMISKLNVEVKLITKNNSLLTKLDIDKYYKQYNNLKIKYDDTFHDRYIIIDKHKVYHLGSSINHAGNKTFSINVLMDEIVIKNLIKKIS